MADETNSEIAKLSDRVGVLEQALREKDHRLRLWRDNHLGTRNRLVREGITDRVLTLLQYVVDESGQSSEDALLLGLSLYSQVLRAEQRGQRLAFLDSDDTIVREIGGFGVPLNLPGEAATT